MQDESWISTVDATNLPDNTVSVVFPKGLSIALIKKDGHVFALRNRCAHMSCTLGGGQLDDFALRCPCHEWQFDIRTGECIDAREITIPTYECRQVDGKVHIRIKE